MRKLLGLFFLALAFHATGQQTKQVVPFRTIRTLLVDLNNDKKTDTITLISSLKDRNSFNRISISLSGFKKKVFNARDYWTTVDSDFFVANKNAIHTKLLFLKKTDKHSVILLFGEIDGAGYRGEFSIINIEDNNVKMVFDHADDNIDVEIPCKLFDLEKNGRLCFVYTTLHEYDGFSSQLNKDKGMPDIGSYTPYLVYPVTDSCRLDKALSKKYMEEHYVFAGFQYSEKINILYPRDGSKPRVWKKSYFH
jgi:hypothetical protein